MNACVLEAVSKLEYKSVPTPAAKGGEVLLKIRACGICSSDVDRVYKTGTYHFPTIPGHEFSGEIVAVGEGVDQNLIGKKAAVFPLLPCFECASCRDENYARCENYNYFGSRSDGGFAEYIAVPVWNLVFFEDISFEEAAMCEPSAVALHAVNTAKIEKGDTVAVVGAGPIGLIAAQAARVMGAGKVILIGRSEKKLELARTLGIEYAVSVNNDAAAYVADITSGNMADKVIELVGSEESLKTAVNIAKKGGRVVLTGNPEGDMALSRADYWKILRSELEVCGTWNSEFSSRRNDWQEALKLIEKGDIKLRSLITHKFPLCDVHKAFDTLRNPSENAIKVMLINND